MSQKKHDPIPITAAGLEALKAELEGLRADVPATAREITDPTERRQILEQVARVWKRTDVETMMNYSPLIEVTVEGA